jgi:hypothetical protein
MQEVKDSNSICDTISTNSDLSEYKESVPETLPVQKQQSSEIFIEVLQKGKKNFAKSFNKLLRVDKEAFGDID